MPLTFPSHAAAVLPLKMWRPTWFDGVALVAGSAAPDAWYPWFGLIPHLDPRATHTLPALLWWCLPVGLLYAWVARLVAPTVAAHLPDSRTFGWRELGVLGRVHHRWQVTVLSVLAGAMTHLLWDLLTHTAGWLLVLFRVDWYRLTRVDWWVVSDLTSSVAGGAVVLALLARMARRGTLRAWHGAPPAAPEVPVAPHRFWPAAGAVAVLGGAAIPLLPGAGIGTSGVRSLHVAAFALVVGAIAVHRDARRPGPVEAAPLPVPAAAPVAPVPAAAPDAPVVPVPAAAPDAPVPALARTGDPRPDTPGADTPGPGGPDPGGATAGPGVRIERMPGLVGDTGTAVDEGDSRRDPYP